ncbi:protein phosphatase 2C domain-containing protein [Toxoplasma gondii ARI]|uniref:Protein phosphatase 2C domain-containing protein n=1 Tax=Toxoplasma gondii ARI TaxID=1074872 RepID=A0A139XZ23_TOXGO|nr:protein phosphatase 2C domain-containing protein [Toxoplasma gondii ARI]
MDGHFDTIQELNSRFTESAPREKIEIGNRKRPFKLHVVNVGDSRAMLVTRESYAALTRDHVPDDPGELRRIQETGDEVKVERGCFRIRGLAMSRSFGDFGKKDNPSPSPITAKPDVRYFYATWEDVLILHSDGLLAESDRWEEVAGAALQCMESEPRIRGVATCLVQQAYRRGSTDNITALVSTFQKPCTRPEAKLEIVSMTRRTSSPRRLLKEDWTFKLTPDTADFSLPMF